MKDLNECRGEIDRVDRQLLGLFEERMEICREVARYKKARGLPVLDASREEAVLEALAQKTTPELLPYARKLWRAIMDISKEFQAAETGGETKA
jgi:monofunctional chorismate mutase